MRTLVRAMLTLGEPLVHVVEAMPGRGRDRARAARTTDGVLLVLADGAGGTAYGAEAAARVVDDAVGAALASPRACVAFLESLDRCLVGETTGIVLRIVDGQVFGASVGDSEAWMLDADALVDLTQNQQRKPLLGSRRATVTAIERVPLVGRVVVVSDGLTKYVQYARMRELLRLPVDHARDALVRAARLPSGDLVDDIAIVLADAVPA